MSLILEKIVNNEKSKNIPVIMVSALREIDVFIDALSRGAIDYIKKPINRDVLLTKIELSLRPEGNMNGDDKSTFSRNNNK